MPNTQRITPMQKPGNISKIQFHSRPSENDTNTEYNLSRTFYCFLLHSLELYNMKAKPTLVKTLSIISVLFTMTALDTSAMAFNNVS